MAAHCVTEPGARNAVEAGVASIEHGFAMTDEILALAKQNGVVLVGTDFTKAQLDMIGLGFSYPRSWTACGAPSGMGMPMAFGSDIFMDVPGRTRGGLALEVTHSSVDVGIPARDDPPDR